MSLDQIIKINRQRTGLDAPDGTLDHDFSAACGAGSRLCVYGRMRPGGPNEHHLTALGGNWIDAQFPGHLQNGAACTLDQCPGLVWTPGGTWNEGFIFTTPSLNDAWTMLDANEGDALVRLLTPVRTKDGEIIANIYASRDASKAQLLMLDGMNVHDDVDFRE